MRCFGSLVLLVVMMAGAFAFAEIASDSQDRRIAVFVTDFTKPTEWGNQDYWRDHWSVAVISFDLDGDGLCDALVCTPDQQASRRLDWLPVRQMSEGGMRIECDLEDTECISCCQDAFGVATISNEVKVLVALDARIEKYMGGKRVWSKTGDALIGVDSKGKVKTTIIPGGGVGELIRKPDFRRLEHIVPRWYVGYRLDLKQKETNQGSNSQKFSHPEDSAKKEPHFRVDWHDGTSAYYAPDESKADYALIREVFMNGRIKCIERIPRKAYGTDASVNSARLGFVVAPNAVASPDAIPKCSPVKQTEECLPHDDKPGKKIIRHRVRGDEDVTGISMLYDISSDEIRRRNKLKRDEDLRPGQIVELEVNMDFGDSL